MKTKQRRSISILRLYKFASQYIDKNPKVGRANMDVLAFVGYVAEHRDDDL